MFFVIGFNVVMFWLLEFLFSFFMIALDWTLRVITRVKGWVSCNVYMFVVCGFVVFGMLLIIKGVIGLIS